MLILPQFQKKCKQFCFTLFHILQLAYRNLISDPFLCFIFPGSFYIFPALNPAPDQNMPAHFESGSIACISSPADAGYVVRFSIRSVYCQKQICDFPSKRCLTIYRRFADKSVQKYLVHRNGFILFLNEFQFPGKYRKHQAVMLFLMSVLGTELSVDLHVFPYVILCHIHQTFRYHHWYSVF